MPETRPETTRRIFLEDTSVTLTHIGSRRFVDMSSSYRSFVDMFDFLKGYVRLGEHKGLDTVDETTGQYRVIGSAAKYLADVVRRHADSEKEHDQEAQRKLLFSGSLAIYKKGISESDGYDFRRHGRIWVAIDPEERLLGPDSLKYLIFGDAPDAETVDAILDGYEYQETRRQRAEEEAALRARTYKMAGTIRIVSKGCIHF